jgi:hypothetical protein
VVIALLFWGSQDSAGDMALERGVVWGLAIAAFPFVYAWQFIRTPAVLDAEQTNLNKSLADRLGAISTASANKEIHRTHLLALGVLQERGHDLHVKRITESEFAEWLDEITNGNLQLWHFLQLYILILTLYCLKTRNLIRGRGMFIKLMMPTTGS